jgi:hypothetical protein
MTEQQPYEVVREHPGFELRRYPDHVVAETRVTGTFGGAGNTSLRQLVGYIGGRDTRPHRELASRPRLTPGADGLRRLDLRGDRDP